MSLRIVRAADRLEVTELVIVVYSPPGLGKTSLAFTAEKPLLLDFDEGAYRSGNRGDVVVARTWADAATLEAKDLQGYRTLVIDTAGRALDKLSMELMQKNPKLSRGGGALTLQGYGELKARFIAFLRLVRSVGLDVILVAHSDEQRGNADDVIERIDIAGGSKNEIYKCADAMARLRIVAGKRTLNFDPSDTSFGKNPAQLPVLEIPDFHQEPHFLAGVIATIKAKLNESSEAATAEQAILAEFKSTFSALTTAKEFTDKSVELGKAEPVVKALLVAAAKEKGFSFSKSAKAFEAAAV